MGRWGAGSHSPAWSVLEEVVESWRAEFDRHDLCWISIKRSTSPCGRSATSCHQVLSSLLDNALWAATNSEGSPLVSVVEEGFTASDNGPCIPKKFGDLVFEPRFTTKDGGHGMGLTLTRDPLTTVGERSASCPASRLRPR